MCLNNWKNRLNDAVLTLIQKYMFYEEIRIKQGLSYIIIILLSKDTLQQQFILMATSLVINTDVVTRVTVSI